VKQKEMVAPGHNLPFQISKFIGREIELDEIANLIANNRLVTLVGTGGIGKTRLSLKAGEQLLNEYANGVWFVELASLSDPTLVPQAVAQLFHIAEQADEPLTQKLARVLRSRTFLIILDNCEHLLGASAQLADALLKNCPNLKVLVTSREPLGITGEAQYHVQPLRLPNIQQILEQLLEYESIQLFEERARLAEEHFSVTMENASSIAQICHHLDGIPLAIELAAARVDMFSTEQIAARLDESFKLLTGGGRTTLPRHQTLRASIDWSWDLLSEPERILLRRLSVFAGGWTLEAAEAVCPGFGIELQQMLDLMTQLVTKSLIVSKQDDERGIRYHLLEMIRQYAHEKLQEAGEVDAIRDKHLGWVLAWAEQIQPEFNGRNRAASLADADLERDNIRLAIDWGLRIGQFERSMKICIALRSYLDGRIPYGETRRWLELGLSHRDHFSKSTLARIYTEAAWVTLRQNDLLHGIDYARESLKMAEELNDPQVVAEAMRSLGVVEIFAGNYAEATTYFEKVAALYQALGNDHGAFLAIGNLALSLFYQGKVEDAIALLAKYMDSVVSLGNQDRIAWFHFALGLFKLVHGDVEMALPNLKSGLSLFHQIKEINFTAVCMMAVAFLASARGNAVRAARLFGAGEAIHESIGTVLDPTAQSLRGAYVDKTRAMLDESAFASAWAEGRAMSLDEAVVYALDDK
jgi:predicted ATPase